MTQPMTSSNVEDYLKAIYNLAGETEAASTSAIAERLGVMSKVFDRVRRVGIDDRIDVQRL